MQNCTRGAEKFQPQTRKEWLEKDFFLKIFWGLKKLDKQYAKCVEPWDACTFCGSSWLGWELFSTLHILTDFKHDFQGYLICIVNWF